jgi:dihydrofolate reductase
MILSSIVAADENNAIGKDNLLPWHLPNDLKFFKKTTLGKPVLMGRKTYESLGKPLPGRLNIVITAQKNVQLPEGVLVFDSIEEGIERMEKENAEESFIIGGGTIFEQTMNRIDRIYLTRVHTVIAHATAFFPTVDHTHWKMVKEEPHEADEKHAFAYTFQQYERIPL